MFGQIEEIRKEITQNISDIENGMDRDKALDRYFGREKKLTKEEAKDAVRYFLKMVRDDIDSKLSDYLYGEAQVLKDTLERIDRYVDEED